jgi:dienelactone hydrolase
MRGAILAALLVACGDDVTIGGDAGAHRDASRADAARTDGGARDGGSFDAAGLDAAGFDAAVAPDAPAAPDADSPPAPEGCISDVTAGHHVFACEDIDYDVEVSAACAMGGCGLIMDVHGATMDSADEDRNTNLRTIGSEAGYVVVQPTAPAGAIGPSWDPARDDPKVERFLELAMRVFRVDVDRVHFTGFSQGGYMTWRFLCRRADLFASVAPAAACTGSLFAACSFMGEDTPSTEVPILYVHGRDDLIVPFSCAGPQRDAVVAGWSMTLDSTVSMDADHLWNRWQSPTGTTFEFIEHGYSAYSYLLGGHCFPGSDDVGTDRFGTGNFGCEDESPFDWGATVLAFFEAHPRR